MHPVSKIALVAALTSNPKPRRKDRRKTPEQLNFEYQAELAALNAKYQALFDAL